MIQSEDIAIIRSDDEYVAVQDVLSGRHDTALRYLSQYAALSAVVYGEANPTINEWVNNWTQLDFDFNDFRPSLKNGVWIKGLKVESYFKYDSGVAYVTIIFRGTRFTKWQDWYANANWLTRHIPNVHNAYQQTILQINGYIDAITKYLLKQDIVLSEDRIKFISAGHSLGGGLAQQAAYASKKIETVYAFDPSPVTGYYSINKSDRKVNCEGLKIYRVWEHGEILLYLRQITKTAQKISFRPNINPRIVEVRFNFVENQDAIKEHSMENLAISLIHIERQ